MSKSVAGQLQGWESRIPLQCSQLGSELYIPLQVAEPAVQQAAAGLAKISYTFAKCTRYLTPKKRADILLYVEVWSDVTLCKSCRSPEMLKNSEECTLAKSDSIKLRTSLPNLSEIREP